MALTARDLAGLSERARKPPVIVEIVKRRPRPSVAGAKPLKTAPLVVEELDQQGNSPPPPDPAPQPQAEQVGKLPAALKPAKAKAPQPPKPAKAKGPARQPLLSPDERRERFRAKLAAAGTSLEEIDRLTVELMTRYPAVFDMRRRALSIGVHHRILAELQCNPETLKHALRRWCSHPSYLWRMANKGKHRHDLDGRNVADISEVDRVAARHSLDGVRKRKLARAPDRPR